MKWLVIVWFSAFACGMASDILATEILKQRNPPARLLGSSTIYVVPCERERPIERTSTHTRKYAEAQ